MVTTLSAALLASLIGTPHCLGMCGGFAAACARSVPDLVAWHVGRILTYSALGALAGGLGGLVPGPWWIGAAVASVLLVWFAAALAGLVPEPRIPIPGLARLGSRALTDGGAGARLLFGLVNGLLPCGLLYATLGLAVGAGGWWQGGLTLAVFGLGTLPGLSAAAWGLRTLLVGRLWVRRALAAGVLFAGLAGLWWRVGIG